MPRCIILSSFDFLAASYHSYPVVRQGRIGVGTYFRLKFDEFFDFLFFFVNSEKKDVPFPPVGPFGVVPSWFAPNKYSSAFSNFDARLTTFEGISVVVVRSNSCSNYTQAPWTLNLICSVTWKTTHSRETTPRWFQAGGTWSCIFRLARGRVLLARVALGRFRSALPHQQ